MVRVLVVEDEANIREMIALNLRLTGMEAVEAESAEAALPLLAQKPGCDAAILDVMLPGMNGFSLCETIRRTDQKIGIIILSAKGQEQDKIRGLSIGADDYMTKPFSVSELLARVEALCRRVHRAESEEERDPAKELGTLTSGDFVLDENRRVLLKAGQPIELTQVEFQIMELFFRNPGIALVREKILKGVWGENYFGDVKIVDVNIRRLRMKVEDEPSHPTHIMTGLRLPLGRVTALANANINGKEEKQNAKRDHAALAAGQSAHYGASGAAGRGDVPAQLHPQLLQQRAADHVPALFLGDRSAEGLHCRHGLQCGSQPQHGAAAHGGTVFR